MQTRLKNKYQDFFKKFNINKKTGTLKDSSKYKFPTYPFIGSRYGKNKKILIIGLDIGSDEKIGGIQSFKERQQAIENKFVSKHNPHIAGTYFTALFFLKDSLNWQKYWNNLKSIPTCQKALKNQDKLPINNPLSYVSLTNYYKFVSVKRKNKTGGENRIHLEKEFEDSFFIDEIKIFNPDIIIFQSKDFFGKKRLLNELKKMGKQIYIGPHPSYRKKRQPEYFIKQIVRV